MQFGLKFFPCVCRQSAECYFWVRQSWRMSWSRTGP